MPRTQIDTYQVYKFSELAPEIQDKLIERQRQSAGEFFDGADCVYEDAATIADLFGLDIRTRTVKLMNGSTRQDPCIYYSGFWSQGDGACFEGTYRYQKGALAAVKDYAPVDTRLHRIVEDLQHAQARYFFKLSATTQHRGHYYHSGCMDVSVHRENWYNDVDDDTENAIIQALRDFADWIYDQLEKEYNYVTSEENAREYLEDSDQEFTAEGEPT
jgi:hypothetical protein